MQLGCAVFFNGLCDAPCGQCVHTHVLRHSRLSLAHIENPADACAFL